MILTELSVTKVRGIGPQRAKELEKLHISTVADLIEHFPHRYDDYRPRDLTTVKDGEKVTLKAQVASVASIRFFGSKKSRMMCRVMIGSFMIQAVWFNQHFLKDRLRPGETIYLTGRWDQQRRQMTVAETAFNKPPEELVQPVYPSTVTMSQKWLRSVIRQALTQYADHIEEVLPEEFVQLHDLLPRREAILLIHQPSDVTVGQAARKTIAYEELFMFQLKLQAYRTYMKTRVTGIAHQLNRPLVKQFIAGLPFELTTSQQQVLTEIWKDLQAPHSMNRLLQGDVGSGKTIVAAISLFAAVSAGYQGALMVPTEILAEQHARSLQALFAPYKMEVKLLTGSLKTRERREVLSLLASGEVHIVIGTHALIQEDVHFQKLSLVVTDEQHRFGVNQRSILRKKGQLPDVLTMTATPIPRTLAITAFGDMDVSTLRERPGGRKPIETYWVQTSLLPRILNFIRKEVDQGHQAYVICPLIEESEQLDVQNAIDVHMQLQQHFGESLTIGLLHGRMPASEKDQVMRAFATNEISVLVATTVVEVGVDVPNATLMIIYDAQRFGLSQLHQLRGRVGRGSQQSYCILIADVRSDVARERMQIMTETNDGFELSRRDLELRGPGDFFGTKQSGLPEFRVADVMSDFSLLEQARDDVARLVADSQFWSHPNYSVLRTYLKREQVFQGEMLD